MRKLNQFEKNLVRGIESRLSAVGDVSDLKVKRVDFTPAGGFIEIENSKKVFLYGKRVLSDGLSFKTIEGNLYGLLYYFENGYLDAIEISSYAVDCPSYDKLSSLEIVFVEGN